MGFFSSRRSEDTTENLENDRSVVRVIRSRFYGKHATGKNRDPSNSTNSSASHFSNLQTLTTNYESTQPRPTTSMPSPSKPATPRSPNSADPITITLAQRLDELAVANSEGLLDDDEYRLLRQSLFDRLAGASAVPTETPLVPLSIAGRDHAAASRTPSRLTHHRRPSSQYDPSTKSPSIQSKRSLSSAVSGFLRKATNKRKSILSTDDNTGDTSSLFSSISAATAFPPMLSKQSSTVSLRTEFSLTAGDSHFSRTDYGAGFHSQPASPSISRSATRHHRTAPPSSYSSKGISRDLRHAHSQVYDELVDDDQAQSAHEIRQEIEAIEAESRRLLDAFNGLELSILVRYQRQPGTLAARPAISSNDLEGRFRAGSLSSPRGSSLRLTREMDATSVRSNQSIQTMFSSSKPPSLHGKTHRSQVSTVPAAGSTMLPRKNSASSMSIHSKQSVVTPLSPAISRTPSRFRLGSTSSVNLSRSANHLPLETVSEADVQQRGHSPTWSGHGSASPSTTRDDQQDGSVEEEMADIRRRRAEVTARYEARLEHLRARLRGAELREKLMRS